MQFGVISTCKFLERLQIALALWALKVILLSLKNFKLHSKSCYLPIETGHENTQTNNQILGVNWRVRQESQVLNLNLLRNFIAIFWHDLLILCCAIFRCTALWENIRNFLTKTIQHQWLCKFYPLLTRSAPVAREICYTLSLILWKNFRGKLSSNQSFQIWSIRLKMGGK